MKKQTKETDAAAIAGSNMLCGVTVSTPNLIGTELYYRCGNPVKYNVAYKEGTRGNVINKNVCGTHFKSLKKWSDRMMKKCQYDVELQSTAL